MLVIQSIDPSPAISANRPHSAVLPLYLRYLFLPLTPEHTFSSVPYHQWNSGPVTTPPYTAKATVFLRFLLPELRLARTSPRALMIAEVMALVRRGLSARQV